jgi:hypothetical protein
MVGDENQMRVIRIILIHTVAEWFPARIIGIESAY